MVRRLLSNWKSRSYSSTGALAIFIAGLVLIGFTNITAGSAQAAAGINQKLNYQGRLLTAAGGVVPDGTYNLEFKMYSGGTGCVSSGSSPCGGTVVWTEDWNYGTGAPDNRVVVRNGYFSVALGSITSLSTVDFNNDTLWLSMNVGNTSTAASFAAASGDGEMLPFKRLAANPYAFNAGAVGGLTAAQLLQLAPSSAQADASTNNSLYLNKTAATGNILDLQRGGVDVAVIANDGSFALQNKANSTSALTVKNSDASVTVLRVDTVNNQVVLSNNGWLAATDSAGTGTVNILKVNANNQIQVGAALNVDGGIILPTDAGQVSLVDLPISSATSAGTKQSFTLGVGSANVLTVYGEADGAGNAQNLRVAIGSSISPSYTLDVSGDINTSTNYRIAGSTVVNSSGTTNIFVGTGVANANTGYSNTGLGANALQSNTNGSENTAIGTGALLSNTGGNFNTAIGKGAGSGGTGSANVFIGYTAGAAETGSNKLYIANSSTSSPLIGGDFSSSSLVINGSQKNVNVTAGNVVQTIQGAASQSADLMQLLNSGATVLAKFDNAGILTVPYANFNFGYYNGGSTLNNTLALGNFSTGGSIGAASGTVDAYTGIKIAQTTASQSLSLPNPTNTASGHLVYVSNTGTATFNIQGSPLAVNSTATLIWNGTVWTFGGTDASSIQNQSGVSQTANFNIQSAGAAVVGAVIKGAASQSADLLQIQNSSGITTSKFNANGDLKIGVTGGTNSTTAFQVVGSSGNAVASADTVNNQFLVNNALISNNTLTVAGASNLNTINATGGATIGSNFQVQNASGTNILSVSTTTPNLIANPSFEAPQGTSGYVALNGSTLTTSSNNAIYGAKSLAVTIPADAFRLPLAKYPVSLTSNTTYVLTFYAMNSNAGRTDTTAGYSNDGISNITCVNAYPGYYSSYYEYRCSFTTGTISGTPYIYMGFSADGGGGTEYIDGVMLQTSTIDGNGIATSAPYGQGSISLNGPIISPLSLQVSTVTPNAFQIYDSSGRRVFNVSTIVGDSRNDGAIIQGGSLDINAFGAGNAPVHIGRGSYDGALSINAISNQLGFAGDARLNVGTSSSTAVGVIIQGSVSQTADLLRVQDSTATTLASISAGGRLFSTKASIGSTSSSATLDVRATAGSDAIFAKTGSSTDNYVTLQNSAGTYNVLQVNNGGGLLTRTVTDGTALQVKDSSNATNFAVNNAFDNVGININPSAATDPTLNIVAGAANQPVIRLTGKTSQSADYLQVVNSGGTILSKFDSGGNLTFGDDAAHTISALNRTTNAGGQTLTIQGGNAGIGATGQAGGDIVIKAGNAAGSTGSANGGNLYLQSGFGTNGGNGGAVIARSTQNSNSAFQVQDTAGNAVLTANTNTGKITINQGGLIISGLGNPTNVTTASQASGGSLTAGTYYYRVAAVGSGGESQAIQSNPIVVTTLGNSSKNTISWTAVTYASSYKVYRSTNGDTSGTGSWYYNTVPAGTTSLVDNGSTYTWTTNSFLTFFENNTGDLQLADGATLRVSTSVPTSLKYDANSKVLALGNYGSGGVVTMQGDSFRIQNTTDYGTNLNIDSNGAAIFKNRVDTTAGFKVQDAASETVVSVSTAGRKLVVDPDAHNSGSVYDSSLVFGTESSGEGIGSNRSGTGTNPNGLDFYTVGNAVLQLTNAGTAKFRTRVDTTTDFTVQNANGNPLFNIDSTGTGSIALGSNDAFQLNFQLDTSSTYADAGTCSTSVNQGSMYYNSNSTTIRTCTSGTWNDVVTSSDLGVIAFGVVPDNSTNNGTGDQTGAGGYNSGPCKVYVGSTKSTVAWNSCIAYSQGRKSVIASGSTTIGSAINSWQNLCINSAGAQPSLIGSLTGTESAAAVPAFSISAPALCLATIKTSGTANTITSISDTRVWTTDTKVLGTLATAAPIGSMLKNSGTGDGQYAPISGSANFAVGALVAWSGTTSTSTPNAVLVTNGPIALKVSSATAGQILGYGGSGYYSSSGSGDYTRLYGNYGIAQTSSSIDSSGTGCSINTACSGSAFTVLNIR